MRFMAQLKKISLIDIILILLCLGYLIMFGNQFGVKLVWGVSLIIMVLRRIDLRKHVMLRRMLIACSLILGISFIIIESFIISELGSHDSEISDVDYIVILGAGIKGSELSLTLQQRLDMSLTYANKEKDIPIIVSGGQGPGESITEAEAMSNYLISKGISKERIILESKSTSTQENLLFSQAIMNEKGLKDLSIMIVTSDYHMHRAKLIAKKTGFDVYGMSSKSPGYLKPINMIREYLATIKTFL
ncbi:YdcF family protein [Paenibacillus sp. DS2015]|uniref:YdcF family protein n=1 Tax=Paenibacillus sp. DS2015 TaxID=3373917 RepID=UPI003D211657